MKKRILLITVISSLCIISKISVAQAPGWLWAKSAGVKGSSDVSSVAVDISGNIYVAGYFQSRTIVFGSVTLLNAGTGSADIFLAKYNTDGDVIWAKSAGGTGIDAATSVAVDTLGNIYIAGYFSSPTITFGSTILMNEGDADIFLAKYDNNGNVKWAIRAGGLKNDRANSVAVDNSGNAYLAGYFSSPNIIFGRDTLTNVGLADIFIAKYDGNGNMLWTKSSGGAAGDEATSVFVDAVENSYLTGWFKSNSITFGSTTLTNADNTGTADMFIVKYDINGTVQWAKSAGKNSDDVANSVTADASGNVFVAGNFKSSDITFGSTTLKNAGNGDIFLVKYDNKGNVLWAKSAGGAFYAFHNNSANSVVTDALGNAYLAGNFCSRTICFGSTILTNVGNSDIFLAKYDVNGDVLIAKSTGGNMVDRANSVAVDISGNVYVAGNFGSRTLIFDSTTLLKMGSEDIFLAKFSGVTGTKPNKKQK